MADRHLATTAVVQGRTVRPRQPQHATLHPSLAAETACPSKDLTPSPRLHQPTRPGDCTAISRGGVIAADRQGARSQRNSATCCPATRQRADRIIEPVQVHRDARQVGESHRRT